MLKVSCLKFDYIGQLMMILPFNTIEKNVCRLKLLENLNYNESCHFVFCMNMY